MKCLGMSTVDQVFGENVPSVYQVCNRQESRVFSESRGTKGDANPDGHRQAPDGITAACLSSGEGEFEEHIRP